MSARPRLLFVSPRYLFPLDEGGKIRTVGILRAMKGGAFETTLASPSPSNAATFRPEIETVCDRFVSWPEYRPTRRERFFALLGSRPVSARSEQSEAGQRILAAEIDRGADVVVIDYPQAAMLMPKPLQCASILFTHNVEAEILERHAQVATGPMRLIWQREAAKMRRFEERVLHRFDTIIAVSGRDAKALKERYRPRLVEAIDTGVDLDFYSFNTPVGDTRTIVFSGAMDSWSNIDGISFMMDDVWPVLMTLRPDAMLRVIGRNPPAALVAKSAGGKLAWQFTGFVYDVRPHLLAGDVAVIPLRVGSGTRLKAFEAMALGRPVVSTRLGVEGLSVVPGEHYLAADSASDFATAIARLMGDASERLRIALNARTLLEERFSWSQVGRQFEAICQRTLAERLAVTA